MRLLKKSFQLKDALYLVLGTCAVLLTGSILHDIVIKVNLEDAIAKGEEITTFPLGSFLGIMTMVMILFFTSFQLFTARFDMVVAMGASRREFFRNELTNQSIRIFLTVVVLGIGGRLECLKLRVKYPDYQNELDMSGFFSWKILLPLVILLLGMIFLVGAVTLKYQKRAMIFYAVLYFVIILLMSRIPRVLKPFIAFLRDVDLPYHILGPVVMILIGIAALAGSWLLIRRQDVRV
ncbi:MAG: hypothetical protein ACI4HQ_11980 [Acetatifactor sp.]